MTITRIAGQSFDARQATQVARLARVWDYARHIRSLARQANRPIPRASNAQVEGPRAGPARANARTLLPSV